MKSKSLNMSRRSFLELSLAGGVTSLIPNSLKNFGLRAGGSPRRHLVNIVRTGGWDSLWFHNGVEMAQYVDKADTARSICDSSGSFKSSSGNILDAYGPNQSATLNGQWHTRYADSFLTSHPSGASLGPGMNFFTSDDLKNVLIWRGISAAEGGHGIGNQIIQNGAIGASFASFSAIVAANETVLGHNRPLNYVQIANSSNELWNQVATLGNIVTPILIQNQTAWTNATSPSPNDIVTKWQDAVDSTLNDLTRNIATNSGISEDTKTTFRSFLLNYQASSSIGNSKFGTSPEFTGYVQAYTDSIKNIFNGHIFKNWFSLAGNVDGHINNLAFRFALTEFLLRKNLTTVIDIVMPGGTDFHDRVDLECIYTVCIYAAYLTLLRRLKTIESEPGSGVSLFDITTTIMHTEFDRSPLLSNLSPSNANTPGTDHWPYTTSLIMSGYGVAGGKIIGDFKRGSTVSAKYGTADYTSFLPYRGLPMDLSTGQVSPSGKIIDIHSINPTIVSLFGASNFSQLNGLYPIISAALK